MHSRMRMGTSRLIWGKIVDYIVKEAHKDEMGDYDPEEILFIVQGEMEYTESLDEE